MGGQTVRTSSKDGIDRLLKRVRELDPDENYQSGHYYAWGLMCPLTAAWAKDRRSRSGSVDFLLKGDIRIEESIAKHFDVPRSLIADAAERYDDTDFLDAIIDYLEARLGQEELSQ